MTASAGGYTYTNDVLGNRTDRDKSGYLGTDYHWDALNRMTYYTEGIGHDDYAYRADGMRIWKNHASGMVHEEGEPDPGIDYISQYYYDGQMQVENYEAHSNNTALLTKYGIGARGIDYMETYNGSTTTVGFPIYDGHGNMIATIGRSASSPYYSTGDAREYDVWGKIRSGNTTGDPKNRYCANLGHPTDDESGLIYMRARYYEPWTGRFVSEDPARDGFNYFVYGDSNPVSGVDPNGKAFVLDSFLDWVFAIGIGAAMYGGIKEAIVESDRGTGNLSPARILGKAVQNGLFTSVSMLLGKVWITETAALLNLARSKADAWIAVFVSAVYAVTIATFIAMIDSEMDKLIDQWAPNP
ncbi:MAG: RHS repeat-associated core domain-containing protein [Armatimonadetes bacterium]|nr:RHS repeat-associated core domain-containing protein [Armatimonadota bacterium]